MTGWFDSHAHLQSTYLLGEKGPGRGDGAAPGEGDEARLLAGALERAAGAGVRRVVCVGTGPDTSEAALALAAASGAGGLAAGSPEVWATAGLHPHTAAEGAATALGLAERSAAAAGSRLVAVGECGLDYHYDHSPRPAQREAFAAQVAAAHRLGLALVVHARDAWDDLFDVLRSEGVPERAVLHCFTGGPDEARRCLDAGMHVSFSGIVTFKTAAEIREAAALVPPDRLLVETDSPFLAPVPHRGKANEPSWVPLVGATVAAVKGVSEEDVARSSWEAASALFGLDP